MSSIYPKIDPNPDFVHIEQHVLADWDKNQTFAQSVDMRAAKTGAGKNNEYVFYDGPPFANGLPHHGHLLTGFVKDLFARYHTMKGQRVERRFGWDCHGLPAEMEAEKDLKISGRKNIMNYGIGNFNDYCRTSVMKYAGDWRYYVNRQARWVDFDNDYKTMDRDFMESVIWAFSELHKKGYIYEGFKVMPYSWSAETVLSTSEIRLDDATREKEDKAVTVAFRLREAPKGAPEADEYYVLAWTTTPWTLPSNLALAVSDQMEYASVTVAGKCYFMAEDAVLFRYNNCFEVDLTHGISIDSESAAIHPSPFRLGYKGKSLIGLHYEPLFPYFAGTKNAFRILDGSSFIEEGSGTGVVHMAPGFGEDDQRVCAENGIDTVVPVDGEGRYTAAIYDLPNVTWREEDTSKSQQELSTQSSDLGQSGDLSATIIETARCILRAPSPEDEAHFVALHTDATVMRTMNDGPLTQEEAKADFARNLEHFKTHGYGQWAVFHKETGAFMGRAGLSFMAQSKEVEEMPTLRCCLHQDFWRGGIGSELCHASLFYGFEALGLDEIAAGAHPDNPRAISMMTRLGMRIVKEVMFKRMMGPYFRITKAEFEAHNPPLSLKGLNVIKETQGQCDDEPYKPEQLEKYGLANLRIINWLKQRGRLIKQEDYKHNYPHCWRTDQPIIYKAMSSWFVDVPQFRDRMVELNQQINWIPEHIKDGRFGKWLENAREWSISRSRFWGCPIPVWRSDNPDNKELYVFGSIKEMEEFFAPHIPNPPLNLLPKGGEDEHRESVGGTFRITDLHRPFIDTLTRPDPTNPDYTIRRVEEVFDCWFESGSMPYAQVHYPFENKEWFEAHFPADFIVEYEAQTRGWFYSMMVLSVALFDRIPFKNCICHGVVLDDKGRKLSKRLKNYMDPKELFDKYGSDALRWFMMSSPIMRGNELLLDAQGQFIHDAIRLYIKPIWNAYNFFTLYANSDGVRAREIMTSDNLMDRYILAKAKATVMQVERALDAYDTPAATQAITQFFEVLNNWYIRRSRERFWKQGKDSEKQSAYDALYTVLTLMCRAAAPLLPMVSDAIYGGLCDGASVHLADWPDVSAIEDEAQLVEDMDRVLDACNSLLSIRNAQNIRIRQPLASAMLYGPGATRLEPFTDLIADEANVKSVALSDDLEAVAEQKLTINFPVAGKRLGGKMKAVAGAAKSGDWSIDGDRIIVGGELMQEGEYSMQLVAKDAKGAQALSTNDALVVLDLTITPELAAEGTARDLIRMIQEARKQANLNVADRIVLTLDGDDSVISAMEAHREYISQQTLAVQIERGAGGDAKHRVEQQLDGQPITIGLSVAA